MPLKISETDFYQLKTAVAAQDTPERRAQYMAGNFSRAESCKNKDQRYRWDLLQFSGLKLGDGVGMQGDLNLYAYMNDEHIDSALRVIVPALQPSI